MALLRQTAKLLTSLGSLTSKSTTQLGHRLAGQLRTISIISNTEHKNSILSKNSQICDGNQHPQTSENQPNSLHHPLFHSQIRHYKAKVALKLRCSGCFFVKRHERLYVECKLKPRHKQMQKMSKHQLYKEDYSEGNILKALHWGFQHDRYYQMGNNQYAKHNWLEGKIGHTV